MTLLDDDRAGPYGRVMRVDRLVAAVGLRDAAAGEVVRGRDGALALVVRLCGDRVDLAPLAGTFADGDRVETTGRGPATAAAPWGRTIDALGRPRDDGPPLSADLPLRAGRAARGAVGYGGRPLWTGWRPVDLLAVPREGDDVLVIGRERFAFAGEVATTQARLGARVVFVRLGTARAPVDPRVATILGHGHPAAAALAARAAVAIAGAARARGERAVVVVDDVGAWLDARVAIEPGVARWRPALGLLVAELVAPAGTVGDGALSVVLCGGDSLAGGLADVVSRRVALAEGLPGIDVQRTTLAGWSSPLRRWGKALQMRVLRALERRAIAGLSGGEIAPDEVILDVVGEPRVSRPAVAIVDAYGAIEGRRIDARHLDPELLDELERDGLRGAVPGRLARDDAPTRDGRSPS